MRNLFFLCAFVLPLCASVVWADNPTPIRIGYVTDLTGRGAFFGVQAVRGAKLAEVELQNIQLIVEDSGGESTCAVTAATKFIDLDRVDAVVCDLTAICTSIAGKVAAANKPLIYHTPATSLAQRYPYAYRNFIDYTEGCRAVAEDWKQRHLNKVATLAPNMEFGEMCFEGFESVYKGHRTVRYNPGDDLRTPMLSLRSTGTEAVLQVGYEPDFLNWFKLCREQKFRPLQGFMEVMLSKSIREAIGEQILNSELFGYQDLDSVFIEKLDRVAPLPDGDFNRQGAAMAYNALKMLARAFDACGDRGDIACLDRSLRSEPPQGLLMGFRGWKDRNAPYPVRLKKGAL